MKLLQSLPIRILILLLMLLMALPAIGLIIHAGLQDRDTDLKDASRASTYLLGSIATELQSKVDASRQLMEMLSLLPEVRKRNSRAVNHLLSNILREHPVYANIIMVDATGMSWAGKTPDNKPVSLADRKAFRDAMATGSFATGEYTIGKSSQKPILNFAFPLNNSKGDADGAILIGINLEQIGSLNNVKNLPAGTSFGLFDHKGVFLYRTIDPDRFIGKNDRKSTFEQMQNGPDEGILNLVSNDGVHRLAVYRKIRLSKDLPPYAYIRGGTPTETTLKNSNAALIRNLAVMTLVLLLVFAVSLQFCKRLIVDRILALQDASERIASGDLHVCIAEQVKGGELGALGQAFDCMTKKLADNIRERNQAAEEFQTIVQTTSDGFNVSDAEGRIMEANSAFCTMLGYSRMELLGKKISDFEAIENSEMIATRIRNMIETGSDSFTSKHRRKDGSTVDVDVTITYLPVEGGRFFSFVRDITDRKKTEESLRSSEAKFSAIFRTSPDSININRLDNDVFVDVNDGFTAMLGYSSEDVVGNSSTSMGIWADLDVRALLASQLNEAGLVTNLETRLKHKDGSILTALVSSRLIELDGVLCTLNIARDITELKHAEQEKQKLEIQLLHSQKLESLGVLAGGIAHDFNNILTSIVGNADLALMKLDPASSAIDNLRKIEQSAAKASDLAKQMLAYSGKGKFVVETIDINRLAKEMGHMLDVSISKKVTLRYNQAQPLPFVEVDATQIRQVVMNLVINASESIGENNGVIEITTGCMDCDKNYLKNVMINKNIKAGRYVYLEVADTGCGMDKETLSKIFDPFFTTKFTGRGLGMAAVQGIVRGHKGFINIYSEPGKGTHFKVFLPASEKLLEIAEATVRSDDWRGEGKVLLVDDEETVRDVGKAMLQELGFTVFTANNGNEAIDVFKSIPGIAFVIMDLTMPEMDGQECFRELMQLNSDLKVIISSGFSEQEVSQKFASSGMAGIIQKPYTLSMLKNTILKINNQNSN